tara:strand:- start:53 stop:418 length:366 start_codon:yes stop_codon:yes gene_type:complete
VQDASIFARRIDDDDDDDDDDADRPPSTKKRLDVNDDEKEHNGGEKKTPEDNNDAFVFFWCPAAARKRASRAPLSAFWCRMMMMCMNRFGFATMFLNVVSSVSRFFKDSPFFLRFFVRTSI